MMSSHLVLPHVGHLKEVFHMFAYLKVHHNTEMVFDLTPVEFDHNLFERQDWSFFHRVLKGYQRHCRQLLMTH